MDDLRKIPVPDFSAVDASRVAAIATAYDSFCNSPFRPLPQINHCPTRVALDNALIPLLGISEELVARIRHQLSREPSITGKPYDPYETIPFPDENESPQLPLWQ